MKHTMPVWLLMQFILILDINLAEGASSGYLWPHSIFKEYILFSYGVRGGPMIIPVQCVNVMSSSFSKPQLIVPSPTPFCPCSNSSNSLKFRGTTENNTILLIITQVILFIVTRKVEPTSKFHSIQTWNVGFK